MPRELITESTVRDAMAKGKKIIELPRNAIVTPLASELAVSKGIRFVDSEAAPQPAKVIPAMPTSEHSSNKGKVVVFGSDHGGYQLKEQLKKYAEGLGYKIVDVGAKDESPCDYPDYAYAVARAVTSGEAWRGVMIDGAGIGSCIVANKVPGVKAACCHNEFVARNAREHNDTNVLTLGSRVTGSEVCKEILRVWLDMPFAGGRHKQRVDKIDEVEKRFLR